MERNEAAIFRILLSLCLALASPHLFSQSSFIVDAGPDTGVCLGGGPVQIGGAPTASGGVPPYTYSWSPATGLNNPAIANPTAFPSIPTTYTVTVTDSNGTRVDSVKVDLYSSPAVDAGPDVTINEGERAELQGSGAVTYYWYPSATLNYAGSPNPDAEPVITTTYYVMGIDGNGCVGYDSVRVTVIDGDRLYFYNTFTPNSDGDNDTWYIGNIFKYPDNKLWIYNRYGKLVFIAAPYLNNWDGRNFGEDVASGTYYYILDPGNGDPLVTGNVTIIR
jgi:gliding motility-associated-like protein